MTEEEAWQASSHFQAILDGSRLGKIAGVHFDLRHTALPDAEQWHAPRGSQPFGVVFPWDRLLCSSEEEAVALVTNGREDSDWPVTHVFAGDTVSVRRVDRFYRGDGNPPLKDEHDATERWAYLLVTRADGSAEEIDQPIAFIARDGLGPYPPYSDGWEDDDGYSDFIDGFRINFEKIQLRIERLIGPRVESPTGYFGMAEGEDKLRPLSPDEASAARAGKMPPGFSFLTTVPPKRVGARGEWLLLAHRMVCDAAQEAEEVGKGLPFGASYLIDTAVAAGYALAMAENELRIAPLAKRGIGARASQEKATSFAMARADPVRAAALKDISTNPRTSQGACAGRVTATLRRTDVRAIARTIAPMFEWVDLPGGSREKRPTPDALKRANAT